jgi:tetratricopeptide (TPR) repeat protein
MLNAMGATLWGAIAITLAAAVAILGYRASLSYRVVYPTASTRANASPREQSSSPLGTRETASNIASRTPPLRATGLRHGQAAIQSDMGANPPDTAPDAMLNATPEALPDEPPLIGHYVRPARSDPESISRVIGKEMAAAQKAVQAQQWQEALRNLEAAGQKSGLTAFDQKTIYNFKGFADIKLNNLKAAQVEFEKALATGDATPEEVASMTRTLFGIAASTAQYRKTVDYGRTLVDNGTATNDNLAIIAQSYYLLKDCKDSGVWADKAIAAARKAGETPKENLYLFKLQCASDAGDTPAMDAVLMDLIKLNNKTTYWNTLLRIERQDERDDHNTLMIYRIMYNTNSMNADTDYIEMAQLLSDAALPGEAAAVLDEAMVSGIVKDEHKERTNRLLTALETRADADKKSLPQQEAEANQSPAGELLVKLGEVYYGFGDYQKAADAISQGLQKGQVTQIDEALVYFGLAQMQLKSYAEAKKTFANIPAASNVSPRLARLWRLYAATL